MYIGPLQNIANCTERLCILKDKAAMAGLRLTRTGSCKEAADLEQLAPKVGVTLLPGPVRRGPRRVAVLKPSYQLLEQLLQVCSFLAATGPSQPQACHGSEQAVCSSALEIKLVLLCSRESLLALTRSQVLPALETTTD